MLPGKERCHLIHFPVFNRTDKLKTTSHRPFPLDRLVVFRRLGPMTDGPIHLAILVRTGRVELFLRKSSATIFDCTFLAKNKRGVYLFVYSIWNV